METFLMKTAQQNATGSDPDSNLLGEFQKITENNHSSFLSSIKN